jgi:hypothetical protein
MHPASLKPSSETILRPLRARTRARSRDVPSWVGGKAHSSEGVGALTRTQGEGTAHLDLERRDGNVVPYGAGGGRGPYRTLRV